MSDINANTISHNYVVIVTKCNAIIRCVYDLYITYELGVKCEPLFLTLSNPTVMI